MSTPPAIATVHPPAATIYRVAYGPDPFRAAPWWIVRLRTAGIRRRHDPKQLGGRFDDPPRGGTIRYPEARRFRTVYCTSDPVGAFVEALQSFSRWDKPEMSPGLSAVVAAEPQLRVLADPADPHRGVVPWSWFAPRVLGETQLDPQLLFVDVTRSGTIRQLGAVLAPLLKEHKVARMGYSAIVGPRRELTQAIAAYVYEAIGEHDADPPYAGIRYASDLAPEHECWAVFAPRLVHWLGAVTNFASLPVAEWLALPGLWGASVLLHLTLEGPDTRLYRPQRDGGFSAV